MVTSRGLTCIWAANDRGNTRFAIERISAINKVAFLDKLVPVVVSSSMDMRACVTWDEKQKKQCFIDNRTSQRPAFVRMATSRAK